MAFAIRRIRGCTVGVKWSDGFPKSLIGGRDLVEQEGNECALVFKLRMRPQLSNVLSKKRADAQLDTRGFRGITVMLDEELDCLEDRVASSIGLAGIELVLRHLVQSEIAGCDASSPVFAEESNAVSLGFFFARVLLLVGLPTGQVDFDEPVRGSRLGVLQSIDSRTDSHGVITGLFTPKTAKSVPLEEALL
jgi:hypothetical protein